MADMNDQLMQALTALNDNISDLKKRLTVESIFDSPSLVPYQELTYTIAAGARQDIFAVFNYFRVISLSGGALSIRLGQNGLETPFTGQGIGVDFKVTFPRITLINTGGTPMTITVALADGRVNDDRLNVSGTVNVQGSVNNTPVIPTGFSTTADVSVLTGATTQVLAANASRKEAFISNKAANATVVRVGDAGTGATEGIELGVGATIVLSTTAAIFVYNPSGGTIGIGVAEIA